MLDPEEANAYIALAMRDPADKDDSYANWPEWAEERERVLELIAREQDSCPTIETRIALDHLAEKVRRGLRIH